MTRLNVLDGCATIQLNHGQNTLVDENDVLALQHQRWKAELRRKRTFYVVATINRHESGKGYPTSVSMHRIIMNAPEGVFVDHRNGDTCDNRKDNLRLATSAQNSRNRFRGFGKSKFKGVFPRGKKWRATVVSEGKNHRIGLYASEEEAARAYDAAAIRLHGEFARTNADIYGEYWHAKEMV